MKLYKNSINKDHKVVKIYTEHMDIIENHMTLNNNKDNKLFSNNKPGIWEDQLKKQY